MNKISSMLDAIADRLEAKGYIKEAYEIDKVADAVEINARDEGAFGGQLDETVGEMKRLANEFFETTLKKLEGYLKTDDLGEIGKLYPAFKKQSEELSKLMATFSVPPYQSSTGPSQMSQTI